MGGWVLQTETVVGTTHSAIVLGSALGLPDKPGRFDIIARNTTPLPAEAVGAYICLGAICTDPENPEPDGNYQIWVTWEQEQVPPGTPVGTGESYQWNGIGNTIPGDSGGYSPIAVLWDVAEFSVMLNGTGFDPIGWPVEITCRYFEWEEGAFDDYDLLPTEPGNPGDPGYLYPPNPLTVTPGLEDARMLTLEWGYDEGTGQDGFAILDVNGPDFPTPIALIPDPDIRSWAFTEPYPRDQQQQFCVTAYNATKKSQLSSVQLDPLELNILPDPGLLPVARINEPYSFQFEAEGGFGDYTYANVEIVPLPTGLTFDVNTGILAGTPTEIYPIPGQDWPLEIVASGPDILDSPSHQYQLRVTENIFSWTVTPPDGDVEPGRNIVVVGPNAAELTPAFIFDDKVVIVIPKIINEEEIWIEVPYPPSSACTAALDDCPECEAAVDPCSIDVDSEECQTAMAACLACLIAEMESIEDAEACNAAAPGTVPPPTVTLVVSGTQFSGSVELGTFTIIVAEGSGLYRFVMNKTNDTIYTAERDGTTYDVKIPDPGAKTGFFRS
jgi:hypothetical protein